MKKSLIFVGSRLMIRELAILAELNNYEVVGIMDHHYYGNADTLEDIPVIGDERWLLDPDHPQAIQYRNTCDFFPANFFTGSQGRPDELNLTQLRIDRINLLDQSGVNVVNLIHPNATIPNSKYAKCKIGRGVQIHANAVVSGVNIEIGDYCALSIGAVCSHDVVLGRNVILAQHTDLFDCQIGDNSFIGMHARMLPMRNNHNISIGNNATVWHCAQVDRDIGDNKMFTTDGRILSKHANK